MTSPAFRRGGFSPRGRGRGAASSPRPKIQMESSSSSDVLPDLETKQSTESINIIGDSYSYDDDENYSEDYDSYEHDWKSHQQSIQNKPKPKPQPPTPTPPPSDPNKMRRKLPQRGRRTIKSRPLQSPPQQPITPVSPKANQNDSDSKKSEKNSNDYSSSSEKENDEHSGKIHNSNSVSVIDPEINKERNIPTDNNNNNNNNDNAPVNSNPIQEYYPPQAPSSAPSNVDNNNYNYNIDQMNRQIIQKPIQNNPANEQTYQISYERALTLWKRPVQMTKNDILVFACQSVHDKVYKKVHIISSSNKNPISFTSPYYSGMIVRHQNGSRFTVFGKSEGGKPAPQLAGISFIDLNGDDSRIRYFRIAIPDEGYEYIPNVNEKDKDLSKIANIGHSLPNIKVYSSALPKKHPNGRLTLDMGPYQVKRSLKNFIIRDEDNNILFLIFKSLDGICKIKAYPPFTPIVTFGLGVAILTSMK